MSWLIIVSICVGLLIGFLMAITITIASRRNPSKWQ